MHWNFQTFSLLERHVGHAGSSWSGRRSDADDNRHFIARGVTLHAGLDLLKLHKGRPRKRAPLLKRARIQPNVILWLWAFSFRIRQWTKVRFFMYVYKLTKKCRSGNTASLRLSAWYRKRGCEADGIADWPFPKSIYFQSRQLRSSISSFRWRHHIHASRGKNNSVQPSNHWQRVWWQTNCRLTADAQRTS